MATKSDIVTPTISWYPLEQLETVIRVSIPQDKSKEAVTKSSNTIFVLDRSGSMAGTALRLAKEALTTLIDQIGDPEKIRIIVYDSNATALIKQSTLAGWKNQVEHINSTGMTDFIKAFGKIEEVASILPADEPLSVIFFTDENDTNNGGHLMEDITICLNRL